jgi:cobalamin biosynthetic protein CobC
MFDVKQLDVLIVINPNNPTGQCYSIETLLNWQQETRIQLKQASSRLYNLLSIHGLKPDGGTALFQWVRTSKAEIIQETLACQGILVRSFKHSLRFGLPKHQWDRLDRALCQLNGCD